MKLRARTYRIYWDAHAWAGVVSALLLFVMFFMGAFALFYPEIDAWAEQPAALEPGQAAKLAEVARPKLGPLLEQLEREAGVAGAERVAFLPEPRGLRAYVRKAGAYTDYRYIPERGRLEPVRSGLGSFLYAMHYLGPLPYGVYIAGVASLALLLALVSGLLIHLKDSSRQWFQFRPERPRRTWTSDMHKVLGVFGLPYQLLYAWTGAVLCLGFPFVEPAFLEVVFDGDERARAIARGEGAEVDVAATGRRAPLPDIDALVAAAERQMPGMVPTWIGLEHVADEASTLSLYGEMPGSAFGSVELVLRARDAALLSAHAPGQVNVYRRFEAWFFGLHYARFGGYGIKLLYALLALASCAVIATGNLVWLERRDPERARAGHRFLERLTCGVCAGVIVATAAAFSMTRWLPPDLPERARVERGGFWLVWFAAALLPFVWRRPRRVSGFELLLGGAFFSLTAAIDAIARTSALHAPIHRAVCVGVALLGGASLLVGARLFWPGAAPSRRRPRAAPVGAASDAPGSPGTGLLETEPLETEPLEADPPHHEAG